MGLEALSRGVKAAHFIELDPWVVRKVLSPNLEHCDVAEQCSIYTMKAEEYLQRALTAPEYATRFDFIRCAFWLTAELTNESPVRSFLGPRKLQ